jgi:hypothetical protein
MFDSNFSTGRGAIVEESLKIASLQHSLSGKADNRSHFAGKLEKDIAYRAADIGTHGGGS